MLNGNKQRLRKSAETEQRTGCRGKTPAVQPVGRYQAPWTRVALVTGRNVTVRLEDIYLHSSQTLMSAFTDYTKYTTNYWNHFSCFRPHNLNLIFFKTKNEVK